MESLLKKIEFEEIEFDVHSSQQFATVSFDREEDGEKSLITVLKDGRINQFEGDNKAHHREAYF